jgi:type I restriction enzyme S subunit
MAKPEIRLKGFDGEWKECPFHVVAKPYFVSNKYAHHQNLLSLSYGKVKRKDINSGKGLLPASFDTYQIIKDGIIVFRFTDLQNDKKSLRVGLAKEEGIISPAYVCVECENISPEFLFLQLYSYDLRKVFYSMGDGLRQTLSYNDVKDMPIYVPSDKEQKFIIEYFNSIESEILSEESKLASLKQVKQACLVSMFPQAGEATPRVRFKGFEGEWMKECAGHLFITFNERNRPDLPVLSANQDIRGMAPRNDIGYQISHNRSNEVTYKVVQPGQFIIHLRSFQGGFAHSSVEGITSPAYTVFGFKNSCEHDDYFWKIIFMSKEFIKRLETITYGIRDGKSISFADFSEMKFLFPSKKEQQCIASYFRSLDKQISLQEQRLEKLKQIKAACLDKMFV